MSLSAGSVAVMPGGRSTLRGILLLCCGLAVFSVQDVILKTLSGTYPLHQAMVIRSLTALPLLLAVVWVHGGLATLRSSGWKTMMLRGTTLFTSYSCYYLGLASMPLANTVALFFTAPLFITLLSVLILKEPVGPRRWAAVAMGFVGVLVMLRPGRDSFDWASLLPIVSGLTYAISMVSARRLGQRETAAALAFYSNLVFLGGALALSSVLAGGAYANESHRALGFLLRGWVMPDATDAVLLTACGVIAATGLVLLTQAYRLGEPAVVTPFEYTALLWGVLNGWLVSRHWPPAEDWLGIAIIVATGLYVLYREGKARSRRQQPPPVGVAMLPPATAAAEAEAAHGPSRSRESG